MQNYTIHTDNNMRTLKGSLEDAKFLAAHFAKKDSSSAEVVALITHPATGRSEAVVVYRHTI